MEFEERIKIEASPQIIYSLYSDVVNWNQWDKEVQYSELNGEFKSGSTGVLKPTRGPKSKISITNVELNKSFTVTSKLPFCLVTFEHNLIETKDATEVIHKVKFTGLTRYIFGSLIGKKIHRGLPITLNGLKDRAEKSVQQ
ncbi:polyketide cyclase [Vibrio ruber]|uniref:polyketide cyclase n=1 Tax=Vibrio ruber TaxID=184755 RepID=UPI0028936053|nr:polyketide cyclase [Vibrio ruber]WNJ97661.1 polyketide cyclase [Vibrio ruber]